MQTANLYQQYKDQAMSTLTKGEIVLKLFDEASKQISTAIFLANTDDSGHAVRIFNCIAKAQKVISTLNLSLDMKYAISIELKNLYFFIYDKLGEAIVNKDVSLMKDLLSLIDELKVAFRQAERMARV